MTSQQILRAWCRGEFPQSNIRQVVKMLVAAKVAEFQQRHPRPATMNHNCRGCAAWIRSGKFCQRCNREHGPQPFTLEMRAWWELAGNHPDFKKRGRGQLRLNQSTQLELF